MKYIYGPVNSRRLGLSLGITLTPYKICTFDCVYCQLGRTGAVVDQRKEYADPRDILEELKFWLNAFPGAAKQLDYITISGAGEPTLNTAIGELILAIRKVCSCKVALITNSSLFGDAALRKQIEEADLIVPTLNTADEEIFRRINRPRTGIDLEKIIGGLVELRKEYRGKIWLEVMLVRNLNDDLMRIRKLKEIIDKINPDKIQLNSPVRVTADPGVLAVEKSRLEKICEIFGDKCEIV